ncbi:Wzz/FepE/Etk N-terminal domain-containing protein [Actinoplanes sp. NPDC089786]|uniref:Wzz/FepE/Etk N-terminal domain-containing protein n=1 Tax=Actinoplanes sp. NPDC089786 TaxID=3155185 RepID=UPI00343FD07B
METVDYLGTARKRLPILIGLPVLAALVATAVVLLTPPKYAVTTYVAAPALIGGVAAQQFSGQQGANQFVAAFSAAATSPKVIDQVAADTGVGQDELRDGVEVKQVGASSQLTLTFTGSDRATVAPVATSMTGRALTFLFASQVDVATQQVAAAEADVTAATKKITDWETANKVTQPDKLFQATLAEQSNLRRQELEMSAVGNTKGASAAKDALEDNEKRLNDIGPKLPGYQALIAQRDASTNALANAQQGLQAAKAQVGAADPKSVSSTGEVVSDSKLSALAQTVPPVAGAGLLIAVLLIVLLEIVRRPTAPFDGSIPSPRREKEPASV